MATACTEIITKMIQEVKKFEEEVKATDIIKWIAIAVISTIAIIGTQIMNRVESENKWYVWYAVAINLLMIYLCASVA